jgi:hypothetical protein
LPVEKKQPPAEFAPLPHVADYAGNNPDREGGNKVVVGGDVQSEMV